MRAISHELDKVIENNTVTMSHGVHAIRHQIMYTVCTGLWSPLANTLQKEMTNEEYI